MAALAQCRWSTASPAWSVRSTSAGWATIFDAESGRNRVVHALIFTAVYSRHMFVWLTFSQTLEAIIAGCEAAWRFYGGVFRVLIPDDMKPIVPTAESTDPQFGVGWTDHSLSLVKRYGPDPVNTACGRALELDVVSMSKITAMLPKATENTPAEPAKAAIVLAPAGFARDPGEYRSQGRRRPDWMSVIGGGATPTSDNPTQGL
ncbi:hypothetical protein DE4576_04932 [Mycobacterium marinum]|uniref:hypothetical protein n=1 Tax=Mycobacterium marinum TaxID=1781 RepID=UPI000EE74D5C|nr:hypothetical protein [Mycobacterium marinum]RFZ62993.1 hypothetical protein DE4576_04932 [Mycobacterium marinum]